MAALLCLVCLDVSAASHIDTQAEGARPCSRTSFGEERGQGGKAKAHDKQVTYKLALMRSMSLISQHTNFGLARESCDLPDFKARHKVGNRHLA